MSTEIASLFARIGADLTDLDKGLSRSADMLSSAANQMGQIGNRLSMSVTLPLSLVGGAAVKTGVKFDAAMRNIQSISKATEAEIALLSSEFLDMSTDLEQTTDSAVNLAEGFYTIQGSGFAGAEALEVLEAATKAATAGLSETETAALAITAKLNAYGEAAENAGETSDLMFKVVDRGVGSFEELASSLANVLPTAANAGISFEELSAGIATLSKQGLSFSESTVSLNAMLLELLKPSDELLEVLNSLGYASGQAALDSLGLAGTLDMLAEAGFDSTDEMAKLFGNVRSLRAALGLTGRGAQLFVEDLAAMEDAAGATQAAFEIQSQSLEAQLNNLKNTSAALGIEMLETVTPAMLDLVAGARGLLQEFRDLDPETKEMIVKFGLMAAAAGPALKVLENGIWIVGGLARGAGTAAKALAALPAFAGDVGAAFSLLRGGASAFGVAKLGAAGLTATLGPLAIALAAAGGAAYAYGEAAEFARESTENLQASWQTYIEANTQGSASAVDAAQQYVDKLGEVNAILNENKLLMAVASVVMPFEYGEMLDATKADLGEISRMIYEASTGWDDYVAAMNLVAEAQGGYINEAGDLVEFMNDDMGNAYEQVIERGFMLSKAQYEWAQGEKEYQETRRKTIQQVKELTLEEQALIQAEIEAEKRAQRLKTTMTLSEQAMQAAGIQGGQLDYYMQRLGVQFGMLDPATQRMETEMRLFAEALKYGVISMPEYAELAEQVTAGTLEMSDAWVQAVLTETAAKRAAEEHATAIGNLAAKHLELSQNLKGATRQQIAQTAISELSTLKESGQIDLGEYLTAVAGVQEAFGLADEKSRALAGGLLAINQALADGKLPAEEYWKALDSVIQDSADGEVNLQAILDKFSPMPGAIDPATASFLTFNDELAKLDETTPETVAGVYSAFMDEDWAGIGTGVTDGIAGGISSGIPAVEAAARAAAAAALAAAMAELGMESPSKEFAWIGRMSMAGLGQGFEQNTAMAADAARAAMSEVLSGARQVVSQQTTTYGDTTYSFPIQPVRDDLDIEYLAYRVSQVQQKNRRR